MRTKTESNLVMVGDRIRLVKYSKKGYKNKVLIGFTQGAEIGSDVHLPTGVTGIVNTAYKPMSYFGEKTFFGVLVGECGLKNLPELFFPEEALKKIKTKEEHKT